MKRACAWAMLVVVVSGCATTTAPTTAAVSVNAREAVILHRQGEQQGSVTTTAPVNAWEAEVAEAHRNLPSSSDSTASDPPAGTLSKWACPLDATMYCSDEDTGCRARRAAWCTLQWLLIPVFVGVEAFSQGNFGLSRSGALEPRFK